MSEGDESCISPRTDSSAVKQNNLIFRRRLKLARMDVSAEQDMNYVSVSANCINVDSVAAEPNDLLCCRLSLPPKIVAADVCGSVQKHITFFRRTDWTILPPGETATI